MEPDRGRGVGAQPGDGGVAMAKLRHVAIVAADFRATAAWFCDAFELEEIKRIEAGDEGVIYLSDGTVNVAIIAPGAPGSPYHQPVGVNHVGFLVDDSDAELARLEGLGARMVAPPPADGGAAGYFEVKLESPDGLPFDISHLPWPGAAR